MNGYPDKLKTYLVDMVKEDCPCLKKFRLEYVRFGTDSSGSGDTSEHNPVAELMFEYARVLTHASTVAKVAREVISKFVPKGYNECTHISLIGFNKNGDKINRSIIKGPYDLEKYLKLVEDITFDQPITIGVHIRFIL